MENEKFEVEPALGCASSRTCGSVVRHSGRLNRSFKHLRRHARCWMPTKPLWRTHTTKQVSQYRKYMPLSSLTSFPIFGQPVCGLQFKTDGEAGMMTYPPIGVLHVQRDQNREKIAPLDSNQRKQIVSFQHCSFIAGKRIPSIEERG